MPRIRSIKPEFSDDEKLGSVSRDARLMFILLWTRCDDHGRFRASPVWLRSNLFPYDDLSSRQVDGWLAELVGIGAVRVYQANGERFGLVTNFGRHQRIDNAGKPNHPDPPDRFAETLGDSPQSAESFGESPLEHGAGSLEQGKEKRSVEFAEANIDTVFDAWRTSTGHERARLDPKRRKLIAAALTHYPPDDLIDAVRGWRHFPHNCGDNERRTVYNDLGLLLRDAEHIERFRDAERHGPAPPQTVPRSLRGAADWLTMKGDTTDGPPNGSSAPVDTGSRLPGEPRPDPLRGLAPGGPLPNP